MEGSFDKETHVLIPYFVNLVLIHMLLTKFIHTKRIKSHPAPDLPSINVSQEKLDETH